MSTTKPNLNTCTPQEAADYSVAMIVQQGGRCMKQLVGGGEQSFCAYGNRGGQHCAVGWLLDDTNDYLMRYEGDASDLSRDWPEDVPSVLNNNTHLFLLLQSFHDLESKDERIYYKDRLSKFISTDAPQYQQWVDMGD